ncbi:ATP-dependent DNA ligase [compost metagenome]
MTGGWRHRARLDPTVQRMAMRIAARPIAYNPSEGQIPEGDYGVGAMIMWGERLSTWLGSAVTRTLRSGTRIAGHKLVGGPPAAAPA